MKNPRAGFTLIESLVALTILAIVLIAGAQLLSNLFSLDRTNRERFVATYLAQECLEKARNTRDTNWLQNNLWFAGLAEKSADFFGGYTIHTIPTLTHNKADPESPPDTLNLTCRVEWTSQNKDQSLEISQILTHWRTK